MERRSGKTLNQIAIQFYFVEIDFVFDFDGLFGEQSKALLSDIRTGVKQVQMIKMLFQRVRLGNLGNR